jgi:hypothetical protein
MSGEQEPEKRDPDSEKVIAMLVVGIAAVIVTAGLFALVLFTRLKSSGAFE